MRDQVEADFRDRFKVLGDVPRAKTEAQPVMWRHHVECHGTRIPCHLGMLACFPQAFANDRRDHRQPAAQFVGHYPCHRRTLLWRQREHFAGVTVRHHRDDAGLRGQPRCVLAQFGLVDAVVGRERAGDRRDQSAVVLDGRHLASTGSLSKCARIVPVRASRCQCRFCMLSCMKGTGAELRHFTALTDVHESVLAGRFSRAGRERKLFARRGAAAHDPAGFQPQDSRVRALAGRGAVRPRQPSGDTD